MDFDEAVLSHESFVSRRYANELILVGYYTPIKLSSFHLGSSPLYLN